jgi:4-amino-4-deoxy-L-arabinose transferase-like glycosyltransferase
MSSSSLSLPAHARLRRGRLRALAITWPRPELSLLLAVAAVLNLWALDRNGYANEYYSAAARSMSSSWHAFLYGSFDAAGVMTVDKPPLALWIQALSVKAFGLSSWSLLVPQALMGVATVALVYDLVRRRFGRAAGFTAGLALAVTPVAVAVSRHNNPDALLVLCCTAAVWSVVRGLEDGRTRWLVLAGIAIGLGFEAKMAAALLVVPAMAAAWIWMAPRGRLAAVRQLFAGGAAMVVVGGAWPLLVALTPASDRPWVSGTSDNSIWSLILGYNGLGRLFGQDGGPGGGAMGGGGGGPFGGDAGVLRLLNESLGGQAGWLLGFALVSLIGIAVLTRLRRADGRTGWLIVVGGSFLTVAVAFSQAQGIFHPYYVSQLAPFAAMLVGAGAGQIAGGGRAARVLAPPALAAGVLTELIVLHNNPGTLGWLPPVLVVVAGGAALVLASGDAVLRQLRIAALVAAMGVLLLAPASWAVQTLGHKTSGTFPAGGPASAAMTGGPGGGGGPGPGGGAPGGGQMGMAPPGTGAGGGAGGGGGAFGGNTQSLSEAVAYVRENGGGTLAVSSQSGAASQLIASGSNVVALGGFSGRESQVSVSWLADAVASGKVRWVLTDGSGGGMRQDGRVGSSEVMAAVEQVCTEVSSSAWGGDTSSGGLYDCQGHAADLRALL